MERCGDDYTLRLHYGIIGYYDWKKGDYKEYSEIFKDFSGVYTNYGENSYIIRWNANNPYEYEIEEEEGINIEEKY